jgi:hypothetical protein
MAEGRRKSNQYNGSKGKMIIKDDIAVLENLMLDEDEFGILYLQFNFLTQEITEKDRYIYNVIQSDVVTAEVIGGETYEIRKQPRALFYADAGGDKQVNKNEAVVLSAEPINEPALYNWYDAEGNLICEGVNFTVFSDVAKTYQLEVISLADGYKDYTDVEVSLKPNAIESISPNPASGQVTVGYKINSGDSAYLSVTGFYGSTISYNYILDVEQSQININTGSYGPGLYTIALVTNGVVTDSKILVKQ